MKQLILSMLVAVISFGFGLPEAEAKRLGGGGSSGMQRQMTPPSAPRQPAATPQQNLNRQQTATPPAAQPKRSWMGPIAGLAAGLGLAALFSHLGLGEEMASFMMMLLLVVGAVILFRLLFRRKAANGPSNGMQYAGAAAAGGGSNSVPPYSVPPAAAGSSVETAAPAAVSQAVADFDAEGFARQAKVNFIRLQAANDAGNLDDIREFTTPEMFAEIRMQLAERGPVQQRTDVVELNAEVVDVVEEATRYIVSVRFNGLLREEADAAPMAFDEIWHLTKPVSGNEGWRIAGIQQIS
ncbi:Tim44 domain-containing protein [Azoarcus indigens]|uniref:Putative lipid-binding transport protein (Tim44 family) n=1 Tax=Azoarcus indigens TaxID=29545 RepID=A0A4R6DQ51_9RHOO|nr:TIM44-like domain-containing protein [Azoarcus indigens]NMG66845.1 Tim44 domain-containing protein [Azoarcus indigens]TDN47013.1 putative lipid-binding transport protein (Tim44 family) [Azoarcus indigens]